jgi:hypothetical protein
MSRNLLACTVAVGFTLAVGVSAQNPPPQTPPQKTPPAAATQDQAKIVTVEGCLMREADVPGRKPNVAERAGVMDDYILTNIKMVKGSAPAPGAPGAKPATPTGTSGMAAMYQVEGIDEEMLKKHVGRRVQIDGAFENVDRAQAAPERTPNDPLVEIRGTVIRQVTGECPAK